MVLTEHSYNPNLLAFSVDPVLQNFSVLIDHPCFCMPSVEILLLFMNLTFFFPFFFVLFRFIMLETMNLYRNDY